jgi:hypothetical protein
MDGEAPRAEAAGPAWGLPAAALVAAVTAAVIAVPYWASSYADVRDDGIFTWFWEVELALLLGTFLAGSVSRAPLWAVLALMSACLPVAVLGRVVIDTAADPTSHNLWPFEVVLAVVVSVPPICVGGLLAWVVRRTTSGSG